MRKILVALAGGTLVMALALPAGASSALALRNGVDGEYSSSGGGRTAHSGRRDHRDCSDGRQNRNGRDRHHHGYYHRYYHGYCEGYGYPDYDYDEYCDGDGYGYYGGYNCCR
jgi:hypothetical protein